MVLVTILWQIFFLYYQGMFPGVDNAKTLPLAKTISSMCIMG